MAFVNRAGADLYYRLVDLTPPWVNGPPSIVFHHGLGFNSDIWAEWLPHLANRFRLVLFDVRGCGRSSVPEPGHDWSFEELAQDVFVVAEATGCGERFHFIGESLGGIMGYYLAIKHADRLRTVVSITSSHQGGWIGGNVRDWDAIIVNEGMEGWSQGMMEGRFRPNAISKELYDFLHRIQVESAAHVILEVSGSLLQPMDLKPDLSSIAVPILLLVGEASPFVPVEALCDIRNEISHAELHVVAGARHGVVVSHPRHCCDVFVDFLERHDAT